MFQASGYYAQVQGCPSSRCCAEVGQQNGFLQLLLRYPVDSEAAGSIGVCRILPAADRLRTAGRGFFVLAKIAQNGNCHFRWFLPDRSTTKARKRDWSTADCRLPVEFSRICKCRGYVSLPFGCGFRRARKWFDIDRGLRKDELSTPAAPTLTGPCGGGDCVAEFDPLNFPVALLMPLFTGFHE